MHNKFLRLASSLTRRQARSGPLGIASIFLLLLLFVDLGFERLIHLELLLIPTGCGKGLALRPPGLALGYRIWPCSRSEATGVESL